MIPQRAALIYVGIHPSPVGRLIARAAPDVPVVSCQTVSSAMHAIARGRVQLLACEPQDMAGQRTEGLLTSVSTRYRTIGTIGVVPRARVDGGALVRLVQAGVHSLLMSDERLSTLDCRRAMTEACVRAGVGSVASSLLALVPRPARLLLEYGLRYSAEAVSVARAAEALQVHRKTLFWWCTQAGLPAPQQLLGWCRLLAVASLLEDSGRRVDHIALDLEFPSGTALRNMLLRYTGLSPSQLRTRDALVSMHEQIASALRGGS